MQPEVVHHTLPEKVVGGLSGRLVAQQVSIVADHLLETAWKVLGFTIHEDTQECSSGKDGLAYICINFSVDRLRVCVTLCKGLTMNPN